MKTIFQFLLITAITATTSNVWGQVSSSYYSNSDVIPCKEVSGGSPVGRSSTFYLSGGDVTVTFQVENHGKKMKTEKLIVDIWKKDGSDYDKFIDTKRYTIEYDWTHPYFTVDFDDAGDYKVAVFNEDETYINTAYITIKGSGGSNSNSNSGDVDTYYYSSSEIISCDDVKNGDPVGESKNFSVGEVTFQVDNDGKEMKTETLIVDIWRKDGSDYNDFVETKRYTIQANWTHPYFKYTFSDKGDYKVAVYNEDEVWINTAYVTIGNSSGNNHNNSGGVGSDYYSNSQVFVCEDVENGKPKGVATTFTIGSSGGYVTFQVDNNGQAMKTETLIVDVWKRPSGSSDYSDFVETKRYTIEADWTHPFFKYTFYDSGDYKVAIYNEDEDWINTGYVTIKKR